MMKALGLILVLGLASGANAENYQDPSEFDAKIIRYEQQRDSDLDARIAASTKAWNRELSKTGGKVELGGHHADQFRQASGIANLRVWRQLKRVKDGGFENAREPLFVTDHGFFCKAVTYSLGGRVLMDCYYSNGQPYMRFTSNR